MIVAVKVVFDLVGVVDLGEAFSLRTVRLLRRLKGLFGITVACPLITARAAATASTVSDFP